MSNKKKLAIVLTTICLVVVLSLGMNEIRCSYAGFSVDIPKKVKVKDRMIWAAVLDEPSYTAHTTGDYIYTGMKYELVEDLGEFCKIKYYDKEGAAFYGYCHSNFLDKIEATLAIDVSHHQGDIDWKGVAATQVQGKKVETAMIKIGQTSQKKDQVAFKDEKFDNNIKGAIDNNIEAGVYFYSKATDVEQAKKEALWVVENVKNYKLKAPVAFDYEDKAVKNLDMSVKTDVCKTFIKTIKEAGYEACLYSYQNFLKAHIDMDQLKDCPIWAARYNTEQPTLNNTMMWQYTSNGKIGGIKGRVDLSWRY